MSLTFEQSEENYDKLYDFIKNELIKEGGFQKVTNVRILDRFLYMELINKEFHNNIFKTANFQDKQEEKYDMLSSLLLSSGILLFILIFFISENETFIRILFGIYILCIYLLAYVFL